MDLKSTYFHLNREEIRELIRRQELKRWWVAEEAGVHRSTLRRWLRGSIGRVKAEHVSRLARVLSTETPRISQPCLH